MQLSVYSIGPAGENLARFAAIQGDFGHVASKNGVGAVMGKKKRQGGGHREGHQGTARRRPTGVMQAADDIAHDLRTDPSARSLYEYGTLPGVSNLSKMGALPVKNYTTNLTLGVDMSEWEAPEAPRGLRPPRPPVQRVRHASLPHVGDPERRAQGQDRRRARVRGLVGRRLDLRPHRPPVDRLAQHRARQGLPRRQRVRLDVRLGDGVPGEGLHHQGAAWLRAALGRRQGARTGSSR